MDIYAVDGLLPRVTNEANVRLHVRILQDTYAFLCKKFIYDAMYRCPWQRVLAYRRMCSKAPPAPSKWSRLPKLDFKDLPVDVHLKIFQHLFNITTFPNTCITVKRPFNHGALTGIEFINRMRDTNVANASVAAMAFSSLPYMEHVDDSLLLAVLPRPEGQVPLHHEEQDIVNAKVNVGVSLTIQTGPRQVFRLDQPKDSQTHVNFDDFVQYITAIFQYSTVARAEWRAQAIEDGFIQEPVTATSMPGMDSASLFYYIQKRMKRNIF
ncbi:hypothetical protein GUITHDRAFT_121615 [Guillardia theta CCMP2712]|uniref:Uncharacterized protein n=1 Tax=Guillardia theta (strain CCMP2712) TaxID=905079 RepID=L1I7G5_GUITC|nr:hypothetical protein GUITHDRAFT_121615 [Guillardia theta CCMP2712]EKX32193.1 hypothetical protein GUITHDRAFT_121615 [Guillardia theta CCMP2712]|eukprot:XP_005819173.1 hypothetical protein GUITHDRAFT_121615 [Guillardia theta CCMP2712]